MCEGVDIDRLQSDFQEARDEIEDLKSQLADKDALISDYERQMDDLRDQVSSGELDTKNLSDRLDAIRELTL